VAIEQNQQIGDFVKYIKAFYLGHVQNRDKNNHGIH